MLKIHHLKLSSLTELLALGTNNSTLAKSNKTLYLFSFVYVCKPFTNKKFQANYTKIKGVPMPRRAFSTLRAEIKDWGPCGTSIELSSSSVCSTSVAATGEDDVSSEELRILNLTTGFVAKVIELLEKAGTRRRWWLRRQVVAKVVVVVDGVVAMGVVVG